MAINNAYQFMFLFDVENGNPNGDPDAGNSPRVDPETNYGFITDVCLKRKIRNYVDLVKEGEEGYNILIKSDDYLNKIFKDVYVKLNLKTGKGKNSPKSDIRAARDFMCAKYFDVRTFGAVMNTGDEWCGIVRGPVQINFSKSISPINIQEITITRQAKTTKDRLEDGDTEIGKKSIIPYALYRAEGYISASLAKKVTGLSDEDVELIWKAIINMFENDHSAARGKMCVRKLIVFKHESPLGNCPSHLLFDKIKVKENNMATPPRQYKDYTVSIDEEMPQGVEMLIKL